MLFFQEVEESLLLVHAEEYDKDVGKPPGIVMCISEGCFSLPVPPDGGTLAAEVAKRKGLTG
jgi:hypothetical protein